ncbi:MAG TPA: hypothetical protein VFL14_10205 [Xanthomonadales bacterium]|nr:hypothetical protein [Xanthomonadales bacterium]
MNAALDWLQRQDVQLALAAWCGAGLLVGVLVGWLRNRIVLGAVAGLVLGPVGWWVTWLLPARFRECPSCSRPIRVQAAHCRHCGADVAAVEGRSTRSSLKGSTTAARKPW